MSDNVQHLPVMPGGGARRLPPVPRECRFDLGSVLLDQGPCSCWVEIGVRRAGSGKWSLLRGPDGVGVASSYTPEEIVEAVREYGIQVTDTEWFAIGWRPSKLRRVAENEPDFQCDQR